MPGVKDPEEKTYNAKIVGNGENAGYQHFLLSQLCFLHVQKQILICEYICFVISLILNFGAKSMSHGHFKLA